MNRLNKINSCKNTTHNMFFNKRQLCLVFVIYSSSWSKTSNHILFGQIVF